MATSGSFQSTLNAINNAFIAKFNSDGNILWDNYYGNQTDAVFQNLAIDNESNVITIGRAGFSENVATSGAFLEFNNLNNGVGGILIKFYSSGNKLWGTYYGG